MVARPVRLEPNIPASISPRTARLIVLVDNPHSCAVVACRMRICPLVRLTCRARAMPTSFSVGVRSAANRSRCMLSVSIHRHTVALTTNVTNVATPPATIPAPAIHPATHTPRFSNACMRLPWSRSCEITTSSSLWLSPASWASMRARRSSGVTTVTARTPGPTCRATWT